MYSDSFKPFFCDLPKKLTVETMEKVFKPNKSLIGSSKGVTESLVLSGWSDYLQDIEDAEDQEESKITLSDILFFSTGCKVLPQREMPVTTEFLHEPTTQGLPTKVSQSKYMFKRLPVIHGDYESLKADMAFGILNSQGFGTA